MIAFGTGRAKLFKPVHDWKVVSDDLHTTELKCEGHCKATGCRDKATGALIRFDLYGQMSRKERDLIYGFGYEPTT